MKPRRRLYAANVTEEPSVAILVHGTFAGAGEDCGNKWWQSGSLAAKQLAARLPDSVEVAPPQKVFHWSGENSERARNKAAVALLEFIKPLEAAGKPYHLIGHSHGGSVIWNMLKMATIKRQNLPGLRTWTTVGTPFLQHRGRDAWNPSNLFSLTMGLLLMRPVFRAIKHISLLLWNAAIGKREAFILSASESKNLDNFVEYPILSLLKWSGIPVVSNAQGVQIGNYDPGGTMSVAAYLFTTGEGLFLLTMAIVSAYLFMIVSLMCIRPVIESYRMRAEHKLEDDAFVAYQSRWLGIWSPDDEAINGLRATLDITVKFLSKMQPQERVFLSDNLNLLSRPIYWLAAPVFNFLLLPVMDRTIRGIVSRSAQGNDRPTANIVDVSTCPYGPFRDLAPHLPDDLNQQLLASADQAASGIAPKLRKLLGGASFTSGLESFSKDLAGGELIHTSYFDHPRVLDLIACNMAWGTSEPAMRSLMQKMPIELSSWFAMTKSQLQVTGTLPLPAGDATAIRRAA